MGILLNGTTIARISGSQPLTCPDPCSVSVRIHFPAGWEVDAHGAFVGNLEFGGAAGGWQFAREASTAQAKILLGQAGAPFGVTGLGGPYAIATGSTHHFGLRLKNSGGISLKSYFDGVPSTENTSFNWGTTATDICLGESPSSGENSKVIVCELAVWNRLLDDADFVRLAEGYSPGDRRYELGRLIYASFLTWDSPETGSRRAITYSGSPLTGEHFAKLTETPIPLGKAGAAAVSPVPRLASARVSQRPRRRGKVTLPRVANEVQHRIPTMLVVRGTGALGHRRGRSWLPHVPNEVQERVPFALRAVPRRESPQRRYPPRTLPPRFDAPFVEADRIPTALRTHGSDSRSHRRGWVWMPRPSQQVQDPMVPRMLVQRGQDVRQRHFPSRTWQPIRPPQEALNYNLFDGIYRHIAAAFNPAGTTKFQATIRSSSGTALALLYDMTDATVVGGSPVTTTSLTEVLLESGAITLFDAHEYRVGLGPPGGGEVFSSRIVCQ